VRLLGVDSVMCPKGPRMKAWARLGSDLDPAKLDMIAEEITLGQAVDTAKALMEGKVRGRVVVNVNA
jgi:acrylyl-CoA reductase (NADPH)